MTELDLPRLRRLIKREMDAGDDIPYEERRRRAVHAVILETGFTASRALWIVRNIDMIEKPN